MDYAKLVGDIALALSTLGSAWLARHRAHKTIQKVDALATQDLDARIYRAVVETLASEEGDRLRNVLHAIVRNHTVDTDD